MKSFTIDMLRDALKSIPDYYDEMIIIPIGSKLYNAVKKAGLLEYNGEVGFIESKSIKD